MHNRAHRLLRDINGSIGYQGDIGLTIGDTGTGVFSSRGTWRNHGIQGTLDTASHDLKFDASAVVPTTVENRPVSVSIAVLISF